MNIVEELIAYKQKIDNFHVIWCNDYKHYEIVSDFEKLIIEIEKEYMRTQLLQQLLGFRLGSQGFSIIELISSAGLTKEEWLDIRDETDVTSQRKTDIEEME